VGSLEMKRTKRSLHPLSLWHSVSKKDRDLIIVDFLEYLNTPRSLAAWMLYKYGEHRQLIELSIDPLRYDCVDSFRRDYAATKFFSKTDNLETGIDTRAVAINAAEEAERQCHDTNAKVRGWCDKGFPPDLVDTISRAQMIVATILGSFHTGMFKDQGWSKGRTTSVYGTDLNPLNKYRGRLDVTPSALSIAHCVIGSSHLWGQSVLNADGPTTVLPSGFTLKDGNVLTVVPKNAKTDRTICYESHCNIRLQLMVGSYIRRRLQKWGVDLDDQSINQRRSRLGSKYGSLATIDLKSASDTIATSVVELLLSNSYEWFELLDCLRSHRTEWPDGTLRENDKFSSMGNGFTFELESLLFYALSKAVTPNVTVYGDDIIVPTEDFERVCDVLKSLGFSVNQQKSFSTGFFRESCGADMFRGTDVTPVYLRSLPKNRGDLVKLHNAIRAWGVRCHPDIVLSRVLAKWRKIHPCHYGPAGYGDMHYHINLDEACPRWDRNGWEGWWYKTNVRFTNERFGAFLNGMDFSHRHSAAALCVATGPKRSESIYDQIADWRQVKHRSAWSFAPNWPEVIWV